MHPRLLLDNTKYRNTLEKLFEDVTNYEKEKSLLFDVIQFVFITIDEMEK